MAFSGASKGAMALVALLALATSSSASSIFSAPLPGSVPAFAPSRSTAGHLYLRGGKSGEVVDTVTENVHSTFKKVFGSEPAITCIAPGRVNLIGEHTDYNDGFVMPCAIDFHMTAAISPCDGNTFTVSAADFNGQTVEIDLSKPMEKDEKQTWSNYVRGVCKVLQEDKGFKLKGAKMAIGGNVPQGGGLSSSAAMEMATATALNALNDLKVGPKELALVGQTAEHWVGCNCGIMDQFISALGQQGKAVMIDCRDLSTKEVELPNGVAVIIVNSNKKHQLAGLDSEYNTRRGQCESAARHFGVTALRDVTSETLSKHASELEPKTLQRARHVVTENERVLQAVEALKKGDLKLMGSLMKASHVSMRDDFEISTPEINALVEIIDDVIKGEGGVRLTGAGFGGSVVCLAPASKVDAVRAAVQAEYPKRSGGVEGTVYVCTPHQGAHVI